MISILETHWKSLKEKLIDLSMCIRIQWVVREMKQKIKEVLNKDEPEGKERINYKNTKRVTRQKKRKEK